MDPKDGKTEQEKRAQGLKAQLSGMRRDAEERDAESRAKRLGYPYLDMRTVPVSVEAVGTIPEKEAKDAKIAGVQKGAEGAAFAAFDPTSPATGKLIEKIKGEGHTPKIFVSSLSSLGEAWRLYQFISSAAEKITGSVDVGGEELKELFEKFKSLKAVESDLRSPTVAREGTSILLDKVLVGALATGSSDVHLEAEEKSTRIRYRIDGVLHDIAPSFPKKNYEGIVSRLKLLSGMKINIRSEAQDGRFTIKLLEKDIEVRVSIIPSEFGETVVMRILDPKAIMVGLPDLGMRPDDLEIVEFELKRPNGLILNTGPTGSGKTTTLYAFLRKLTDPETKTITVEDPIEYRLPGVEQTQVDSDAGYTFAKGLRAIVRQDPDVILVGEIRDLETADIALQASLTGHLVLSTLHTNSALGAVPRLVNLGVRPDSVGPALTLVIAQRLVRVLCEKCKKPATVPDDMKKKVASFLESLPKRVDRTPYRDLKISEPVGCEACNSSGYKGRKGIFEFFRGGPEFEEQVLAATSEVALTKLARAQGMVPMQHDGVLKVLEGTTDFAEVERITGPVVWE